MFPKRVVYGTEAVNARLTIFVCFKTFSFLYFMLESCPIICWRPGLDRGNFAMTSSRSRFTCYWYRQNCGISWASGVCVTHNHSSLCRSALWYPSLSNHLDSWNRFSTNLANVRTWFLYTEHLWKDFYQSILLVKSQTNYFIHLTTEDFHKKAVMTVGVLKESLRIDVIATELLS